MHDPADTAVTTTDGPPKRPIDNEPRYTASTITDDALRNLYNERALLRQGAAERSALLEEARDALETAGIRGPHGDHWPRLAPGIKQLASKLTHAEDELDRLHAAESADAAAGSYAGRVEELEARVRELEQLLAESDAETAELADHSDRTCEAVVARDQAEATIARVRVELDAIDRDVHGKSPVALAGLRTATSRIRAALDQPATEHSTLAQEN
ncbi:hypothetical protein [Streptomyces hebeiensis]